jgi:hypothetical protein
MIHQNLGKQLLDAAKLAFDKKSIDQWVQDRNMALDYFNANTLKYTENVLKIGTLPSGLMNPTKRIMERVSLVYMVEPIRSIDGEISEIYQDDYVNLDMRMQRGEILTNLLDAVAFKRSWRNDKMETDLIWEYELLFSTENAMQPVAFTYPISTRAQANNDVAIWEYWDADHTYLYERPKIGQETVIGKIIEDPDNPDHENGYGLIPVEFGFRDGVPDHNFLDVDIARDVVQTNLIMNVVETAKTGNIVFQSYGKEWIAGDNVDITKLPEGVDERLVIPEGAQFGIESPPNTIESIEKALDGMMRRVSINWHLPADFFESQPESGTARRERNQELQDDRRNDIKRYKNLEKALFEIDKVIFNVETGRDIGSELTIDFSETEYIMTQDEKREADDWDLAHNMKDEADILMERDPDQFPDRADAVEHLVTRGWVDKQNQTEADRLVQALQGGQVNP